MTHAELLRSHANLAIREGGMYYSGEYLSGIATVVESLEAENANLRERTTTQKQTIQAYRDESREWREVAEHAQAENAKLRELVKAFDWCTENFDIRDKCDKCPLKQSSTLEPECEVRMAELGIKKEE